MSNTKMHQILAEVTKETLCSTPDLISAKVSPDGKMIARVGGDERGIANVSISKVGETVFQPLSFFETPNIIQFFWSADSRKILVLHDENGTGQLQLHGFDLKSKEHLFYTEKYDRVNAKIIQISSRENKAVIGLNHRNPHFHDLYLLDLDSNKWCLLLKNDRFAKFLFSDNLELILKMEICEDGSWNVYLNRGDLFFDLTAEDAFQTEFLSYNEEEKTVYFLDCRNGNTNRLTRKSIEAPFKEKVLGLDSKSDVDATIFTESKPAAFATYYTQRTWHCLDPAIEGDLAFLNRELGRNFEFVNQSREGKTWILSRSAPDRGNSFWIYNRDFRELIQISGTEEFYSKMYEMVISSRDGKELVCYYTIPKELDRGGKVDAPLPLVVVPHGGPFKVRDKYEFNLYHQWLASCGYVALSVNFRLSSGFGKDFVNAGNGQWGGKAHLDVIDGVEACIAKRLTKRGKLAVFGGSYGGFESLASLTFSPGYFACCVSICGPSNLKTVLQCVPEFWEFTSKPLSDHLMFFTKQAFITSMGGDPNDEKGAQYLEKCSPLNCLDHIQTPLLLIHGKNDHVVTVDESEQIYRSMKKRNQEVIYILFPDEGHRFGKVANRLMCFDQAERFLAKYLKGKYTLADEKHLSGATGQIFR